MCKMFDVLDGQTYGKSHLNMRPLNIRSNEKHQPPSYAVPTMCRPEQGFSLHWKPFRPMFPCSAQSSVQCFSNEDAKLRIELLTALFDRYSSYESPKGDLVAKKRRYHTRRGKV
jgi:hypothetical protein